MKTLKINLPFLSEIVYKKKTKHLSSLTLNEREFTINVNDDTDEEFLNVFENIWKSHILNYLYNDKKIKTDTNFVFAYNVFDKFYQNRKISPVSEEEKSFFQSKLKYFQDISSLIRLITSQRFENEIINNEELNNKQIIKDYVETEKNIVQSFLDNIVFEKNNIVKKGFLLQNNNDKIENIMKHIENFEKKFIEFYSIQNGQQLQIVNTFGNTKKIIDLKCPINSDLFHYMINNFGFNELKGLAYDICIAFKETVLSDIDDLSFVFCENGPGNSEYKNKILLLIKYKLVSNEEYFVKINQCIKNGFDVFREILKQILIDSSDGSEAFKRYFKEAEDAFCYDFEKFENKLNNR